MVGSTTHVCDSGPHIPSFLDGFQRLARHPHGTCTTTTPSHKVGTDGLGFGKKRKRSSSYSNLDTIPVPPVGPFSDATSIGGRVGVGTNVVRRLSRVPNTGSFLIDQRGGRCTLIKYEFNRSDK